MVREVLLGCNHSSIPELLFELLENALSLVLEKPMKFLILKKRLENALNFGLRETYFQPNAH